LDVSQLDRTLIIANCAGGPDEGNQAYDSVPFTLRNIQEDLEDIGALFGLTSLGRGKNSTFLVERV
jgi:hypothetical protein